MSIGTLLKFLRGDREAILTIASSPRALWIGLLFVLSAGIARNWDRESLWHEPWHLLLPVAVSTLTAAVLFNLFYLFPVYRLQSRPGYVSAFRAFLQTVWMTAPLAWLYVVPWNHFLDVGNATSASLWTLAVVSVWRVLLITRVLSVLFGCNVVGAFCIVMVYCDVAAVTAVAMLPFPIVNVMGGIQLGESEEIIAGIAFNVLFFGILSFPLWAIGSLVAFTKLNPRWAVQKTESSGETVASSVGASRWGSMGVLAIVMLMLGFLLLPLAQPAQMRRFQAERLLLSGQVAEGVSYISQFEQTDFPPHWDPPPRKGYGQSTPSVVEVAEILLANDAVEWMRAAYASKLDAHLRNQLYRIDYRGYRGASWEGIQIDVQAKLDAITDSTPHLQRGAQLLLALDPSLSESDRDAIEAIIKAIEEQNETAVEESEE